MSELTGPEFVCYRALAQQWLKNAPQLRLHPAGLDHLVAASAVKIGVSLQIQIEDKLQDISTVDALNSIGKVKFKITRIEARGKKEINDESLKALRGVSELQYLGLASTSVTGAGLQKLRDLPSLVHLDSWSCAVDDKGVDALKTLPELRLLWLGNTRISDAAGNTFREMKSLRDLRLELTPITIALVQNMQRMPEPEVLWIIKESEGPNINDEAANALASMTGPRQLYLNGTAITDIAVRKIVSLPRLYQFNNDRTKLESLRMVRPCSGAYEVKYNALPITVRFAG